MDELRLSATDLTIWVILIVSQGVLCLCVLGKGVFRRLPFFATYIFASFAESLLLIATALMASYATYYYTFYWTGRVISVLAFLTLLEFARQVLPGLDLPEKERALTLLLAGIGAIAAFVILWPMHSLGNEKKIEVGACLGIALTFLFVTAYSRYLRLSWSRLLGGVSFTLGMLYLIHGITKAIIGHYPSAIAVPFREFRQIANVIAVITWTVVVLSPWGEYKLTEDDLLIFQEIVGAAQASVRRFIAGGSE